MTTPRRRIIRPPSQSLSTSPSPETIRKIASLNATLTRERQVLSRWMSRLKRAFHAVERQQARMARIERQLKKLEESACNASSR